MNKKYLYTLLSAATLSVAVACGSSSATSAIDDIREAEAATAVGDMEAAKSVASRVLGSGTIDKLPASELARLSLVYMQIADSTDRESSVAYAADLYRRAYKADPDSAASVYSDVNPEMYPYVEMLRTLVGRIDNPYNPEADSIDEAAHTQMLPDATEPSN